MVICHAESKDYLAPVLTWGQNRYGADPEKRDAFLRMVAELFTQGGGEANTEAVLAMCSAAIVDAENNRDHEGFVAIGRIIEALSPPPEDRKEKPRPGNLLSEGGMVPPDNPDRFAGSRNGAWAKYSFAGKDDLPGGSFISIHGGFNTLFVNEEPDRMLAVDAFRRLASEGEIAALHDDFLSTCGNGGAFETMDEIGRAWAGELQSSQTTAARATSETMVCTSGLPRSSPKAAPRLWM